MTDQAMQVEVAEALLDKGVALPLWSIWIPGLGKRKISLVMRRPYMGSRIRALRYYARLGVTYDDLVSMSRDEEIDFVSRHGKTVARLVAQCICRGYISGIILAPIVAWLLLWRTRDDQLLQACVVMVSLISTRPFLSIIRSMEMSNLLTPRLSHKSQGS